MATRGGFRAGGGRPKGSVNKRTLAEREEQRQIVQRVVDAVGEIEGVEMFKGDAVALAQLLYRDPRQPMEIRLVCMRIAAPYERPALAAIQVQQVEKVEIEDTTPQVRALLEQALRTTIEGKVDEPDEPPGNG